MIALVLGATGLCGGAILKALDESSNCEKAFALTRRELVRPYSSKVNQVINADSSSWPAIIPTVDVVFTGLSTTRKAAGSLKAQYKIDHDMNLELIQAAKKAGAKSVVLVSSKGASADAWLPYLKLKGEIENDVAALGFEKTVLLRPGLLLGDRDSVTKFTGFGASFGEWLGKLVYRTPFQFLAGYPVFGHEVGVAAVLLAESLPKGVHVISSQQILELTKNTARVEN